MRKTPAVLTDAKGQQWVVVMADDARIYVPRSQADANRLGSK